MIELSVCIANHRTPELTRQCVQSVLADANASNLPIEVLVVNNTLDVCDLDLSDSITGHAVTFLQNQTPLGFSANQNQMMRRATGRFLLPLNSDTVVQPGALRALVQFMDAHPACGMAGPRLIHADQQLQSSCRNFPNFITCFLESSGLWRLLKGNAWVGRHYYLCSPHMAPRQVDWLSGACLIVRAEVFHNVGGFDEALFPTMFGEDMEWCWRMKRAGWQIWFTPSATIMHLENASLINDRIVVMYRGAYAFCRRHYSRLQRWGVWSGTTLGLLPRWAVAHGPSRRIYRKLMRFQFETNLL